MIRELFAADVEGIESIGAVGTVFEEAFFLRRLRKRQADDFGFGELLLQSSCSELKVRRTYPKGSPDLSLRLSAKALRLRRTRCGLGSLLRIGWQG